MLGKTLRELRSLSGSGLKNYEQLVQTNYRRERLFFEALKENFLLLQVYDERVSAGADISYKDVSRLEFEIAYIYSLIENISGAIRFFKCSMDSAKKVDDKFGFEVGRFRITATKYLAGILPSFEAVAESKESRIAFVLLSQDPQYEGIHSRCIDWIYNIDWRLFDIAAEIGDIELAKDSFSRIQDYISLRQQPGIQHEYKLVTCEALLSFIEGKYEEALRKLAEIVDLDLSVWGMKNDKLVAYATQTMGLGLAREYLFAGRALVALNEKQKAREIFEAALKFPTDHANYFYQDKIRIEVESMSP